MRKSNKEYIPTSSVGQKRMTEEIWFLLVLFLIFTIELN